MTQFSGQTKSSAQPYADAQMDVSKWILKIILCKTCNYRSDVISIDFSRSAQSGSRVWYIRKLYWCRWIDVTLTERKTTHELKNECRKLLSQKSSTLHSFEMPPNTKRINGRHNVRWHQTAGLKYRHHVRRGMTLFRISLSLREPDEHIKMIKEAGAAESPAHFACDRSIDGSEIKDNGK